MDEVNPYQSPQVEQSLIEPESTFFADPPYLWVRDGAVLPARCVKTNEVVSKEELHTAGFEWKGESFQLVLSAKRVKVTFALSRKIRRKSRLGALALLLVIFGAVVMVTIPNFIESELGGKIGVGFWVAFCFAAIWVNSKAESIPKATGFKDGYIRLEGCCPEFLESLPQIDE